MGGLRVVIRILTFFRLGVLARILTPFEFGLFAVATMALGLVETLTETGVNVFFIQKEGRVKDYINSAFVVSIIRGVIIAVILFLLAMPLAMTRSFPLSMSPNSPSIDPRSTPTAKPGASPGRRCRRWCRSGPRPPACAKWRTTCSSASSEAMVPWRYQRMMKLLRRHQPGWASDEADYYDQWGRIIAWYEKYFNKEK